METLTVLYYEADNGDVILHDEEEHGTASRLMEPVIQEGTEWRFDPFSSFDLPHLRWREKVYQLQKVNLLCTEQGRPVFERHPEVIRRMIERLVRRSVINQIGGSYA